MLSLRNVPSWPTDLRDHLELLDKNACQTHLILTQKDTHNMPSFSSLLSSSLSMLDLDLVWLKTEEECGIELVAVFQPIRPEGETIPHYVPTN